MSSKYTDKYIEKSFLYLLAFSLLLHAALFALVIYLPPEKRASAKSEPIMVDLRDLPPSKISPRREEKEVNRKAEERRRVAREIAPKGEMEREKLLPAQPRQPGGEMAPRRPETREETPETPSSEGLLKPRQQNPVDIAKLFPGAQKMARLEESYRKKYDREVEEGEASFLNTDDIQFGSFLRRFEDKVYGVWRYPEEAVRMGIEGVVPVRITFNRKGEIQKVEILEGGSGSKILDSEVRRTLQLIGAVGPFPKGYDKETFNLIAFFQYGIVRGMSRSLH